MGDLVRGPWQAIHRPGRIEYHGMPTQQHCDECQQTGVGPLYIKGTSRYCTDCMVLLGHATAAELAEDRAVDLALERYKEKQAENEDGPDIIPEFDWFEEDC